MDFFFNTALPALLPHWPFPFMALVIGLFGQVAKDAIWTKERATTSPFYLIMRGTLPVHGVIVGCIAGFIGFPVSPGVEWWQGAVLYHGCAGVASTVAYDFFKHWAKSKAAFKDARAERLSTSEPPPGE
jgi:hypothetical protein